MHLVPVAVVNNYQRQLAIAKRLAKEAGDIMLQYFNSAASSPTMKSDRTIVTKADTEINDLVIERLKIETPGYSVWGEEQSSIIEGAPYTWVCDPVDGTMPFSKGIPVSSFSLALVNENGESVVGVIYDPFQGRLFEAVKGGGAFLNGTAISVSQKSDLDGAYIDEELWINNEEGVTFDTPKNKLNKAGAKVTTQCSAVLMGAFVAKGAYEAMVFGQGKPEDIAALAVIVAEAGGKVTDLFGDSQRYDTNIKGAIVSNGAIHPALLEVIKRINYASKYMG
ncbi:MAG TPA: inositol monophosphatase [Candidatus Saccharimonadales bacterium]|nr:inositol monophosphatase [Candidatus Saccharimonadales bacterium]